MDALHLLLRRIRPRRRGSRPRARYPTPPPLRSLSGSTGSSCANHSPPFAALSSRESAGSQGSPAPSGPWPPQSGPWPPQGGPCPPQGSAAPWQSSASPHQGAPRAEAEGEEEEEALVRHLDRICSAGSTRPLRWRPVPTPFAGRSSPTFPSSLTHIIHQRQPKAGCFRGSLGGPSPWSRPPRGPDIGPTLSSCSKKLVTSST